MACNSKGRERLRRKRRCAWLMHLLLCVSGPALAQDPADLQDQLRILEQLPPERRAALMEELLRRQDGGSDPAPPATPPASEVRQLSPQTPDDAPTALGPGSSIVIDLASRGKVEPRAHELGDRILAHNPYQLDRFGRLHLPGFEPLSLLGLTEELAAKRLAADPDLSNLVVKVTRLPLQPVGEDALMPFGYQIFTDAPSTFAPVTDVPIPADYQVGPGDELRVQLFGNVDRRFTLTVGRDGQISFPQLGPIAVGGKRFLDMKEEVEARVSQEMIGVRANVEMGAVRSIRVFLLGEVPRPGSYTISALSTVTHALFAGGGITHVGSLRSVQLKRSGEVVKTLDLYDLLLRGDTRNDARLLSGDVVFVPPVGARVGISGEVLRPALYEIHSGASLAELIELSGDMTPKADPRAARLERINEDGERMVVNLDLGSREARAMRLRAGDLLRVLPIRDTLEGAVQVEGHVLRPGSHEHRSGLRISDVLSFAELAPRTDTHYVLIRRELPPDRRLEVRSADLAAALAAKGSDADVLLEPRDRLTVFDLDSRRTRVVSAVLRELRAQATLDDPLQVVTIGGRARAPGEYPLEPGMRVSDLLRAGASLEDAAYGGRAELARREAVDGEQRETDFIEVDLAAVLAGDRAADVELQPYDMLTIKELPHWGPDESVALLGEVRFPGVYPIARGETLHSVIRRAGGLTELAFAEGAVFTREELRVREQQQIDQLTKRLRRDVALVAIRSQTSGVAVPTELSFGEGLLAELESARAVGRLVIDLETLVADEPGGPADVTLRPSDRLIIPKESQVVTVIGEVQNATSHRWGSHLRRNDYIDLSGGFTSNADKSHTYVVRASGRVEGRQGNAWYQVGSPRLQPGDTVVVPLDAERMPALPMWTSATQILYQLAIAAAVVATF